MIWFKKYTLGELATMQKNTISEHIGIEYLEVGEDYLKARMPVDKRTQQPFGICHGGAYVVLAEELGSMASYMHSNPEQFIGVGVDINANHVKAVYKGFVTGICKPIHIKGKIHVWEINMFDDNNDLCSISRFTCQIVPRKLIDAKKE